MTTDTIYTVVKIGKPHNTNKENQNMKISKLKLCWSAFIGLINPFGSMSTSVADYVLGVLKNTMAALSDTTREKIQAALNTTLNVLAVLVAVKWLIPTKWQTAYAATIAAVEVLVNALSDLEIDKDELTKITDG